MALDPLSLLILLFFLAVVALALTLWFLLTLGQQRPEPPRPKTPTRKPVRTLPTGAKNTPKNDDFRGAAAKPKPAAPVPEQLVTDRPTAEHSTPEPPTPKRPNTKRDDAFERFISSKNDELEF